MTTGFLEESAGRTRTNGIYRLEFRELPPPYKGKEGTRCHQFAEVFSEEAGKSSIGYVTIHHPDDDLPASPRDWDAKLIGTSLSTLPGNHPGIDVDGTEATVTAYETPPATGGQPPTYVVQLTTPSGTIVMHGMLLDQITKFLRDPKRSSLLGV